MKEIWILAKKDLRVLLRDPKAVVILLIMPLVFILVLGISLGEGFGQTPDDRLRVSVVDLDRGYRPAKIRAAISAMTINPNAGTFPNLGTTSTLFQVNQTPDYPQQPWSKRVLKDLAQIAKVRVELIASEEEAKRLVRNSKRAAVLVFGPKFSERVATCSFLEYGINPFFRDGVDLERLDAKVLIDPTQQTASSIIKQVAQGTLLRVVMPWMIGQAFEKVGDPEFIDQLSQDEKFKVTIKYSFMKVDMRKVLQTFSKEQKKSLAGGLQNSLQELFPKYNLTAKTWTALTKSKDHEESGEDPTVFQDIGGAGFINRGALRYQLLVPSYTVMFAFFLVLTVGWLFVAERRQGTMKRLCAAPLSRTQILVGKFLPCFFLSLFQGIFLLLAGKVVFAMSWGPQPWWLILVVITTSLAAMGMALMVAALARTETQVAIYGTLLVLVLAGLSGCLMGDRSLMPETMQKISRITPHAWALDAYRQLLVNPGSPNVMLVGQACGVLTLFGLGFIFISWWALRLE